MGPNFSKDKGDGSIWVSTNNLNVAWRQPKEPGARAEPRQGQGRKPGVAAGLLGGWDLKVRENEGRAPRFPLARRPNSWIMLAGGGGHSPEALTPDSDEATGTLKNAACPPTQGKKPQPIWVVVDPPFSAFFLFHSVKKKSGFVNPQLELREIGGGMGFPGLISFKKTGKLFSKWLAPASTRLLQYTNTKKMRRKKNRLRKLRGVIDDTKQAKKSNDLGPAKKALPLGPHQPHH